MLPSVISFLPAAPISSLIAMTIQRTHLLLSLLCLEMVVLSMILTLCLTSCKTNTDNIMLAFIILTFGACEACVGLACLVALMRTKGNDMISSSSSNKC